jgi:ring-1,2-phenylacetyl-CoA epoxidase subunit PaaC
MNTQADNLLNYFIALGDDSHILGHRLSEWCRNGPFLEEDLALTNVALDFMGRARMFYSHAAELEALGRSEDDIAYLRDCRQYRNFLINELPIGDFAFTMARQLLVDTFDVLFYAELQSSNDPMLAAIAAKAIKESRYHLRRSQDWIKRLGDGSEESHQRTQAAFDQLWAYSPELFEMSDSEIDLVKSGAAVDRSKLKEEWTSMMSDVLKQATLTIPNKMLSIGGGRSGHHSEHLGFLLAEMQFLQRTYPGQQW